MEVLAPLNFSRHHDSHSDWYRQYKHSGGLATPKSSTSHISLDSFDRPQHYSIESRPTYPLQRENSNMSSNQVPTGASSAYTSPRHATLLPPINAAKPSLPPLRSVCSANVHGSRYVLLLTGHRFLQSHSQARLPHPPHLDRACR